MKCKLNQRTAEVHGADIANELRLFTSKHRPSFAEAGVRALEVEKDLTRPQRDLLVVYLCTRPGKTRPETAFYVADAEVKPIDSFGRAKSEEMKQQLKEFDRVNKRTGAETTLFVMLFCMDKGVSNIAPVGV